MVPMDEWKGTSGHAVQLPYIPPSIFIIAHNSVRFPYAQAVTGICCRQQEKWVKSIAGAELCLHISELII